MTKARGQKMAVAAVRKVRLVIGYNYEFDARGYLTTATRNSPTWIHDLFGDDFLSDVVGVYVPFGFAGNFGGFFPTSGCTATDQNLLPLKTFSKLRLLNLAGTRVTDSGMARVAELPGLQDLDLWYTNVGDKGIARLRGLHNLRHLNIEHTKVTNSGLAYLKDLPNLEVVYLAETAVDDNGLVALAKCRRLKEFHWMTPYPSHQFTPEGIARFKRALPRCRVIE
jgi:hypothetical protein